MGGERSYYSRVFVLESQHIAHDDATKKHCCGFPPSLLVLRCTQSATRPNDRNGSSTNTNTNASTIPLRGPRDERNVPVLWRRRSFLEDRVFLRDHKNEKCLLHSEASTPTRVLDSDLLLLEWWSAYELFNVSSFLGPTIVLVRDRSHRSTARWRQRRDSFLFALLCCCCLSSRWRGGSVPLPRVEQILEDRPSRVQSRTDVVAFTFTRHVRDSFQRGSDDPFRRTKQQEDDTCCCVSLSLLYQAPNGCESRQAHLA